jgi:hypothetical protein
MNLRNLSLGQLTKAHQAADYLLSLPDRLDTELAIKLDTLRADLTAEIEDRGQTNPQGHQASKAGTQ